MTKLRDERKAKIIKFCDYLCLFSLYGIAFFLPISKAIIESLSILAIFSYFIKKVLGANGLVKTPLNLGIFLYLAACVSSLFVSTNLNISSRTLFAKTIQEVMFFFMVVETLSKNNRIRNLLYILFISATLLGIDGIYQHFTSKDFIRNRPDLFDGLKLRIYASFYTPNAFGCYLAAIIPFLIISIFQKTAPKFFKILYIGLFLLLVTCLSLTVSRGAWLAFLASFLFMSMWLRLLWILLLVIAMAVIALLPFCQPMLRHRLANFLNFFSEPDIDRKMIWQAGSRMFVSRPLLGLGLGTFMFNFKKFVAEVYPWTAPYAHNCYLQMASEIGIIGLVSFLTILGLFFYYGVKIINKSERTFDWYVLLASLAAILGYCVQMAVDTTLYSLDLGMLFWLVLGLGVAALKMIQAEKETTLSA